MFLDHVRPKAFAPPCINENIKVKYMGKLKKNPHQKPLGKVVHHHVLAFISPCDVLPYRKKHYTFNVQLNSKVLIQGVQNYS